MPETPDFEKLARAIIKKYDERLDEDGQSWRPNDDELEEELRLIWNARGAADIAKLDTDLTAMMGVQMAGPYVKNLDRALRTLDR